ncbi:APC family permease [Arthrobacter sp. M4]|uniref:APC family permease n=1 Tax=Arthrobacter sp. M4 TaxID=218160 RepID=UPI001CDD79B4|nr:APC family permease [Arthrobacter sp. M4]MCA4131341.1 APC family permease [Arthrobacter sp. M4]
MTTPGRLARRLNTTDAVVIGLGSMIGAGVFAAFTPAAQAAGSGLILGLLVAAFVAYCNATSSAQLAASYPTSGGTYVYGRERLGPWAGFLAGWGFVVGKSASSAAMALTFAAYAAPPEWQKPAAVAAVVVLAAVNYRGVTRTAALTRAIVAVVLGILAFLIALCWVGTQASPGRVLGDGPDVGKLFSGGAYGILQAAGLLFFAFAGYARIATMGEEVIRPRTTIPRAIVIALGIAVAIYAVVGISILAVLGPSGVAGSATPLADAVAGGSFPWSARVVRAGAGLASLGALLALIAGLGRTALAMARHHDLPHWLSAVHVRFHVPHRAEVVLTLLVCLVILVADVRSAIGFSSFGVLVYYLIANLSAYTQPPQDRLYPRVLQLAGAAGCVLLVATLPVQSVMAGAVMFAAGVVYRALRLRLRR